MTQWSRIKEANGFGITGERLAFWESQARFQTVAAGRRSLKSILSRRKLILRLPNVGARYIYSAPTQKQAKQLGWKFFNSHIPASWIKSINGTDLCIETIFGSELWVVGLDKPQRIEGNPIDGILMDESADYKAGIWAANIRPMLSDRNGFAWRIGVPDFDGGSNEEFRKAFDSGLAGEDGYESFTWKSSDVIPASEIDKARSDVPDYIFRQEYEASWENAPGRAYDEFTRALHVSDKAVYKPELPLYVSCDFNIEYHNWGLYQRDPNRFYNAFDELHLRGAVVSTMINALESKIKELDAKNVVFFGDYSGDNRSATASQATNSAWRQIRNAFPNAEYLYRRQPAVSDRINFVNGVLRNAKNQTRFAVNPKCVNLIEDLEKVTRTMLFSQDKASKLTHASDNLGYMIHQLEKSE